MAPLCARGVRCLPPVRSPMAPLYFYQPNLSGQYCVVSRQEQAEWGSRPPHGRSLCSPCLPASPILHRQNGMALVAPREPLSSALRCYPGMSLKLCFPGVTHLLQVGCMIRLPLPSFSSHSSFSRFGWRQLKPDFGEENLIFNSSPPVLYCLFLIFYFKLLNPSQRNSAKSFFSGDQKEPKVIYCHFKGTVYRCCPTLPRPRGTAPSLPVTVPIPKFTTSPSSLWWDGDTQRNQRCCDSQSRWGTVGPEGNGRSCRGFEGGVGTEGDSENVGVPTPWGQ